MNPVEDPGADRAPATESSAAPLLVIRNDEGSRFEGRLAGELVGVIDYLVDGDVVVFTHTGTEPRWRGQGVARELTRAALAEIRRQGRRLRPVCPFTARYLQQHPEDLDLLP